MLPSRIFLAGACLLSALLADAVHGRPPARDLYGDPLPAGAVARLGTVRFRHDSTIVFAAFLPGGKSVVSVSYDGVVCAWEFPSGKAIRRFEAFPANERPAGSAGHVSSATVSPDGKHLTAFCTDGFLRVWDLANAKHLGKVADVRGPDVRGGGYNPRVRYRVRTIGIEDSPVHSPDGNTLMLATRVLQFVDLPTGKEIGPSLGHTDSLRLDRCEIPMTGACELAKKAPFIEGLRILEVSHNHFGPAGLESLLGRKPSALHTLRMRDNNLSNEGAALLADSPASDTLHEVDLSQNELGVAATLALTKSAHLGSLRVLRLADNPLNESAMATLAASPLGQGLSVLE
jgi:hypothetical protein